MKILSIFTALIVSVVAGFSQGGPIYRNPATTNQFMNSPGAGEVPIWNSTAGKWSNGVFSATSTNIPAYVLTNNQSSPINLSSSVRVAGTQTNVGAVYFDDKWYIDSAGGFFQLSNPSSGVNALTFDESTDAITIGTAGGTPVVTIPTLLRTDSNDITGHLNVNSFYSTNGFKLSNTLIVDTNGNDSTAIRSSFLRPFLTITGAVAAVQNGDTILVRPGLYTVTPKIAETNRQGAINLFNLTNVTIISGGRGAVIDGTSALGEVFYATNCENLTIEGFRIRGMVGTNITSIGTVNEIWGSLSYYNCPNIRILNNFFDGGHDHGTFDMATFNSSLTEWTIIHTDNPAIIRYNEFYNLGSARTNSNLPFDGTAISPTAAIVEYNWIHDCYRAVEPYAASAEANVFRGTSVRYNLIQNCLEDAITTAGSTNGWNITIEGNRIEYDLTYTRRGTNVFDDAVAILWNSGQRPIIKNNYIYGAPYRAIQVASSLFIDEPQIIGNYIEETTNNVGNATAIEVGGGTTYTVKGALVSGNTVRRARSEGLKLAGVRDSIVSHNNLIDPTSVGIEGAAIRINSDTGVNSNILVIANNVMGGASLAYGIFVDAGSKAIRLVHNQLNGASTNIFNASGAEVAILQPPTTLTASRPLILDADNRMTTATGTPDGTKFLRDDGTLAVPSVGAGDTNNIVQAVNFLSLSNNIVQQVTNIPGNTVTIDMNGPRQVRMIPTGTFAATFTNQPSVAATGPFRDLDVTVIASQSGTFDVAGPVPIDWGPDGGPVFVSGLTNRFTFRWNGTNFFGINHQAATTGSGSTYVLATSPVLVTPHLGDASATNLLVGTTNVVSELSKKVTRFTTNYTQASITVNCSTDVHVNVTNAVGSNIAITLATPVIGTSGSLSLISDGSARTLPILAPVAITWLSTNDTASATNILTTASKRSLFCWSVRTEQAAAAAPTTNIFCWVKNQP